MIDTPKEAAIGDKAARELLTSEKLIASLENNDLYKRVHGELTDAIADKSALEIKINLEAL